MEPALEVAAGSSPNELLETLLCIYHERSKQEFFTNETFHDGLWVRAEMEK